MSFILDALSRSHAVRSRKTSALAQPASPAAAWAARQRRRLRQALALAGLGACATVAALWTLRPAAPTGQTAAPAPPAQSSSAVLVPGAVPAMGSLPRQVARPVAKFVPPTTLSQPLPLPLPSPRAGRGEASVMATAVPPPPSLSSPVAAAEVDEVKSLSELPVELRARIARVKLDLYVHAPQRGRRFVMAGGRQLREGDELIPGVRLDEITEAGMVLNCNGLRVLAPQP